jgi:hypothetical protein
LVGSLELAPAAIRSFFTVFALTRFFSSFIAGVDISKVVVDVALEDVILGIEVVVEVVVKVAVRPWLWPGAGGATLAAVLTGLASIGLLSSPIKKVRILRTG